MKAVRGCVIKRWLAAAAVYTLELRGLRGGKKGGTRLSWRFAFESEHAAMKHGRSCGRLLFNFDMLIQSR